MVLTTQNIVRPRYGLGQLELPKTLSDQLARSIVDEVEPRTRAFIAEERSRLADAAETAMPLAMLSGLAFLGTSYLVSPNMKVAKLAGYGASAALLGAGLWWMLQKAAPPAPPAPPPTTEPPSGFTKSVTDQMAKSIMDQAEPRIRTIVQEEKDRLAEAGRRALPYAAGGIASFIGTAYAVPAGAGWLKMVGYLVASGLTLFGIWKGLEKEGERI